MSAIRSLDVFQNLIFKVRIESGMDTGRMFQISPPMITMGRGTNCSIVLRDPRVSRVQCQIEFRDEIHVVDKSSRQTTFLNGNKISKSPLRPGDIISFGDTRLRFITESKLQPSIETNPPNLPKLDGQPSLKKDQRPIIYGTLGVILVCIFAMPLFQKTPMALETINLVRKKELREQIEESELRRKDQKDSFIESHGREPAEYQSKISTHFIRGYRDLQTMNFDRAAAAFGATLAKDPNHLKAQRFQEKARQKKEAAIEKHLYYGNDYSEKLMFKRCAAEFEKAMVLINKPNNEKYLLAKSRKSECDQKALRGGL